jgi:hypothetical protein
MITGDIVTTDWIWVATSEEKTGEEALNFSKKFNLMDSGEIEDRRECREDWTDINDVGPD